MKTSRWLRWGTVSTLILLFVVGQAGLALAHANLVRSEPVAGAVLSQAPARVLLEFSENLDLNTSSVELTDVKSQVVVKGPGETDPASPRMLMLPLPALPDGVYSAVWQARSAADGHFTQGSVSFSVGVSAPRASFLPRPGAPEPGTTLPPVADTVLRWLGFLAVAVGLGSVLFGPLVWRPAYAHWENKDVGIDQQATSILRRLALWGNLALILITLALLFFQAGQVSRVGIGQALAGLLLGRTGLILGSRLGLLILLAIVAPRLPPAGSGVLGLWGLAALAAGGVLLTFSLLSHAVTMYPPTGVLLDWLHLVAMSAWIGGLLPLLVLLRQREGIPLGVLVPRFSMVALPSVGIMALTGSTSALFHVMMPAALMSTSYGWLLLFKVTLFGLLFLMGAVNLLVLSPRLQTAKAANWLRQTVRTEIFTGLLVILGAGTMTDISPAFEAWQAQQQLGIRQVAQSGNVNLVLWVAPGKAGDNELAVDVSDRRAGVDAAKDTVLLRLQMMEANAMGVTQVETLSQDHFRYSARGSYLSMVGHWQVDVIVRQPGVNDIRHTFLVMIHDPVPMTAPMSAGWGALVSLATYLNPQRDGSQYRAR
jgi:copper transport protein